MSAELHQPARMWSKRKNKALKMGKGESLIEERQSLIEPPSINLNLHVDSDQLRITGRKLDFLIFEKIWWKAYSSSGWSEKTRRTCCLLVSRNLAYLRLSWNPKICKVTEKKFSGKAYYYIPLQVLGDPSTILSPLCFTWACRWRCYTDVKICGFWQSLNCKITCEFDAESCTVFMNFGKLGTTR